MDTRVRLGDSLQSLGLGDILVGQGKALANHSYAGEGTIREGLGANVT